MAEATKVPSTTARTTQPSRVTQGHEQPEARATSVGQRSRLQSSPGAAPRHGVTGPKPITRSSRKERGTASRLKKGSPTPTWVPVNASTQQGVGGADQDDEAVDRQQQVVDQEQALPGDESLDAGR